MAFKIDVIEDEFYTSWWIVHSEHFLVDPVKSMRNAALQAQKFHSSTS